MDFHHLKYFVEVADKKSFSKAARTLHISQSAISRTIKALEEELGVVLFMRNAKAVELTDAGTIFLSHAKRVVFMFEHLKTDFENEFKLEQGMVLIGLPPITGAPIFANLLGAFKQEYPQIELDLYEHGSKKVEISVQEGLIDAHLLQGGGDLGQDGHDLGGDLGVEAVAHGEDHGLGAAAGGLGHGHRRGDAEGSGLVGGGRDDAPAVAAADDDRAAGQLGVLEELDRGEEGVHVDVDDGGGGVIVPPGPARGLGTGCPAHLHLLNECDGLIG